MDYASLTGGKSTSGSIKRWINYGDIDAEQIVDEAMSWINGRLRVPAMRKVQTGTISSGADTLAFPTDFLEERWLGHAQQARGRIKGSPDHEIEAARIYSESDGSLQTGTPSRYSLGGNPLTAFFDCKADQAYAYRLVYLGRIKLDSTTNTTNWLTDNEPRVMRCVTLAFANEFLKREGEKQHWLALAADEIQVINARMEMQLKAADIEVSGGY